MRKIAAIAALACLPVAAIAEVLPNINAYLDGIKTDVTAKGSIGFNHEGKAVFVPDGRRGSHPVQFAVDRETLTKINENCTYFGYNYDPADFCQVTVNAEVWADGPIISMLIFDVTDFEPSQSSQEER